jgi:hypothetical protein
MLIDFQYVLSENIRSTAGAQTEEFFSRKIACLRKYMLKVAKGMFSNPLCTLSGYKV